MKRYIKYQNFEYLCNLFAGLIVGFVGLLSVLPSRFLFLAYPKTVWIGIAMMATSVISGLINLILRLVNKKFDKGVIPNILFMIGFSIIIFAFWNDR